MQAEEKKDVEKIVALQSAIKFNGGGMGTSSIVWTRLQSLVVSRSQFLSACKQGGMMERWRA